MGIHRIIPVSALVDASTKALVGFLGADGIEYQLPTYDAAASINKPPNLAVNAGASGTGALAVAGVTTAKWDNAGFYFSKNIYNTNYTLVVATEAGSSTIGATCNTLLLSPAAALTAYTVVMPTGTDGRVVQISTTYAITTLTLTGTFANGAPTTLTAGQGIAFIYRSADSKWYRLR